MFKNLRHHRRSPSNPTSPIPEQSPVVEAADHGHAHHQRYQDGGASQSSSRLSPPSTLPPITRAHTANYDGSSDVKYGGLVSGIYEKSAGTRNGGGPKEAIKSPDTLYFSSHPKMPGTEKERPESAGNAPTSKFSSQYQKPSTASEDSLSKPKPPELTMLAGATSESQSRPAMAPRRATGTRLATPPPEPISAPTFENAPSKSRRMNLLNPMSLLARRRTSQAVAQLSTESLVANRTSNSGPSYLGIRGTVVHDFSAPRPRRVVSSEDPRLDDKSSYSGRGHYLSPDARTGENSTNGSINDQRSPGHTPVFTENFEEEQYPAAGPHVRKASDLSDLTIPKPPYAKGTQRLPEPSPGVSDAGNLQKHLRTSETPASGIAPPDLPPAVPPRSTARSAARPDPSMRVSIETIPTPPRATLSAKQGRPRNLSEVSIKDAIASNLPKHMKSTSSRFSFDMIGAAEQERLLEDRHRQRALEKKADNIDAHEDYDEDDYDYDNMDDEGLEEDIPLVGDDYDEDVHNQYAEDGIPMVGDDESDGLKVLNDKVNISRFTFQQPLLSPLSPNSPGMASTPRDVNGEIIGFAVTKNSPYLPPEDNYDPDGSIASSISTNADATHVDMGLGPSERNDLRASMTDLPVGNSDLIPELMRHDFPQSSGLDDDDLYFDDGLIDELGELEEGQNFDESVFDNDDTDQYGRPLHSFSTLPTLYSPPNLTSGPSRSFQNLDEDKENYLDAAKLQSGEYSAQSILPSGGMAPQASVSEDRFMEASRPATGLTQDSLAAYQSALAQAAFNAAADGKFRRDSIPGPISSESENYQPGLVTDSSHESHCEPFSPSYEVEDDFDYDDALEDDAIIAAANAEALAYDTDGFYGQEFGFYSAPAGESEYTNGGYFGARGADGVNRSKSGRIADRERNLTPITERSEYSNRNSFMSIPHHQRPESLASPGLAHLLSSPGYESDMSLDALMKLRRGAWGGSQVSLHSSVGSPRSAGGADESPVGQYPPWSQSGAMSLPMGGGHRRANSSFSLVSEAESETNSRPSSPTLTMANFVMPGATISGTEKEVDAGKHEQSSRSFSID